MFKSLFYRGTGSKEEKETKARKRERDSTQAGIMWHVMEGDRRRIDRSLKRSHFLREQWGLITLTHYDAAAAAAAG